MKLLLMLTVILLAGLHPAHGGTNRAASQTRSDELYRAIFQTVAPTTLMSRDNKKPDGQSKNGAPASEPFIVFCCLSFGKVNTSSRHLVEYLRQQGYHIAADPSGKPLGFMDWNPGPQKGSRYRFTDKAGKHNAILVEIDSVRWLSRTKAVVKGGYFLAGLNASHATYTFVYTKKGWKVKSVRDHVVS